MVNMNSKTDILKVIHGGYWVDLRDYRFVKELYAKVVYDTVIQRVRSTMIVTRDGDIVDDRQCVLDDITLKKKLIQRGEIIGN